MKNKYNLDFMKKIKENLDKQSIETIDVKIKEYLNKKSIETLSQMFSQIKESPSTENDFCTKCNSRLNLVLIISGDFPLFIKCPKCKWVKIWWDYWEKKSIAEMYKKHEK